MIQERRDKDNGDKVYIPWTMFVAEDGKSIWRQMELDSDSLPFWKPPKNRQKTSVMVHEGAKAADYCDRLVNDPEWKEERKAHPWADELARYEHWGASGGALAIYRSDFDELRRESVEGDVIFSCDNDAPGVEAAKTFSRCYGRAMYMIRYDGTFRPGWDLADPVPEALVNKNGTAKRTLLSMMEPATWATMAMPKQKGERQTYALSRHFKDQWLHSTKPLHFHHTRLPLKSFDAEEFDALVAPFSDVNQTSRLLVKALAGQAIKESYEPGSPPGLCHDAGGKSFINIYEPSAVVLDFAQSELTELRRRGPIEWRSPLVLSFSAKLAAQYFGTFSTASAISGRTPSTGLRSSLGGVPHSLFIQA